MRGRDDLPPFSRHRRDALDLACIDVGKDAGCTRLQSSAPTACGAGEYKLSATMDPDSQSVFGRPMKSSACQTLCRLTCLDASGSSQGLPSA
jgi:hypothetical protein